jgi:hypothetical protein
MIKGRREMMYDQRQKRVHRLITHKSNHGLLVHADMLIMRGPWAARRRCETTAFAITNACYFLRKWPVRSVSMRSRKPGEETSKKGIGCERQLGFKVGVLIPAFLINMSMPPKVYHFVNALTD